MKETMDQIKIEKNLQAPEEKVNKDQLRRLKARYDKHIAEIRNREIDVKNFDENQAKKDFIRYAQAYLVETPDYYMHGPVDYNYIRKRLLELNNLGIDKNELLSSIKNIVMNSFVSFARKNPDLNSRAKINERLNAIEKLGFDRNEFFSLIEEDVIKNRKVA